MADNTNITPGTGEVIASDDIAGVKYQRVKIALGVDGAAQDLPRGSQVIADSLPVAIATDQPPLQFRSALTDRSGSVTTGGTSQQIAAANTSRRYLLIVNISDTVLWVNFGVAAVADQPSIPLQACSVAGLGDGGILEYEGDVVPSGSVNLIGATTGKKFVAKEA